MSDFGMLSTMPWLIAEADGRGDRAGIRRLLATAAVTAIALSLLYLGVVLGLATLAPKLLPIFTPQHRDALIGPLLLIASVGALMMVLRLFSVTVTGLQYVRFQGTMSICSGLMELALIVVLLKQGYGLYALAVAATFPSIVVATAGYVRVRIAAPDLLRGWPRPRLSDIRKLLRESVGAWFGQWGWRLTSATDGIILASLGSASAVTALAVTSRLGSMLMMLSWIPGDNALVGLANLHGEGSPGRLRQAVVALLRVNIAMAGAAVCVVLAANPGFVVWWTRNLDTYVFAGDQVNGILATALMVTSIAHVVSVVTSVLGHRLHVGTATIVSGAVQAVLAYTLGKRLGVFGVVLASVLAQSFILLPLLARPFAKTTGVTFRGAVREAVIPLAVRSGPLAVIALFVGLWLPAPPFWGILLLGAVTAGGYLWLTRNIYLDYPPIQALLDRVPVMPPALRRRLTPATLADLDRPVP
jgi:Na+-driven multidrug efflux pump